MSSLLICILDRKECGRHHNFAESAYAFGENTYAGLAHGVSRAAAIKLRYITKYGFLESRDISAHRYSA